ncbi:HsdM family class I SAM-dependent methyltransferase [Niallia taxi]|uniref:HsdM family class I SAM-dependent methyltransferase n=1 Tax=Niallia taxi TaxID=2499688 RepID=UPI0015F4F1B8|nr:N-6 DNA methylase [Niallia taxi]
MGRKEKARLKINEKVKDLLNKDKWNEDDEKLALQYSGYGGIYSHGSSLGQFYTAQPIIDAIVQMMAMQPGAKVAEPSCGNGKFIYSLPSYVKAYGCELDGEAAAIAQKLNPESEIKHGDGLEFLDNHKEVFDFVIGNPPFAGKVQTNSRFASKSSGNVDIVTAFIEKGMESLKEGGYLAMVVPHSVFMTKAYGKLRDWITTEHLVRALVSLPSEAFAATGTKVHTSIIVFQKKVTGWDYKDYPVLAFKSSDVGVDEKGYPTNNSDLVLLVKQWLQFKEETKHFFPAEKSAPVLFEIPFDIPIEVLRFKAKKNSDEIEQLAIAL